MKPVEKLLSRLERVRRTGQGRWVASSPTRLDRHPSLGIRELDDGRVLVHDFGGDDVGDVLAAVGLDLHDLYPAEPGNAKAPTRRPFSASDLLELMAFECSVAVVICSDKLGAGAITEGNFERLLVATRRLADALEVCRGQN